MEAPCRKLWLVRHAESAGNVAREIAERDGLLEIDVAARDVDVELSSLGQRQARSLGSWLAAQESKPSLVYSSPHIRAHSTAQRIHEQLGLQTRLMVDERLREKELGLLNRLTRRGMQENFPEQAALRSALGKFYFRPPSGESWCDVILRLRSFLESLLLRHPGHDVLIASHQVVIVCMRYILEGFDEAEILRIDRTADVANCSVTTYERRGSDFTLLTYNSTEALRDMDETETHEPSGAKQPV